MDDQSEIKFPKTHSYKSISDDPFNIPSANGTINNMIMTWSATEFDVNGNVSFLELSRSDLHHKFNLNSRDVRLIVSTYNYPTIISREKCIIVDINEIHSIICADRVYLLRMRDEELDSEMILEIQHAIKNKKDYGSYSNNSQPFEMGVLEVLLDRVNENIEGEYRNFASFYKELVSAPDLALSEERLHDLLQLKHKLNRLSTFTDELYTSIAALLGNDADMASMYLTNKMQNHANVISDHEEVEMLLETYYSQFEDVLNRTRDLINGIKSTQDFLSVSLDSVRNKIMQIELRLSIASVSFSLGTFVAGIFGMNLLSGMEDKQYMFGIIALLAASLSFLMFRSLITICARAGLFTLKKWPAKHFIGKKNM